MKINVCVRLSLIELWIVFFVLGGGRKGGEEVVEISVIHRKPFLVFGVVVCFQGGMLEWDGGGGRREGRVVVRRYEFWEGWAVVGAWSL